MHDGDAAPPRADGGDNGEPPGWSWRLTFEYDADRVRIVARQHVAMLAPPDDSELIGSAKAGYWVELRDAKGRSIYRQIVHDPIQHDFEVFSPEPGTSPTRVEAPQPKGVFQAVVPDLPGATEVVLYGRGSRLELAEKSAKQLVKAPLREPSPPGGPER
jgi:hypothetical protein